MGKKKKGAKAEGTKADGTKPEGATKEDADTEAKKGDAASGKEEVDDKEASMEAYKAAAVLFYTRAAGGRVEKVLLAWEERKVHARSMGLEGSGSVIQKVIVFPQGRKEKKDKNDPVETAKREYIEETTDFANLARYLDFADFGGEGDEDPSAETRDKDETWTGSRNLAVYFAPARMVCLFCEVKREEAEAKQQAKAAEAKETADEPAKKKQKVEERKPSPSYRVGKKDHLQPFWVEADDLRRALLSGDRAPALTANGEEAKLFPTNCSALKLPEVRVLLDLPEYKPKLPDKPADKAAES